jgi:hypothetical protein
MYGSTIVSDKIHFLLAGMRRPFRAALIACLGAGFVFLATASIQIQEVVAPQIDRFADGLSGHVHLRASFGA